MTHDTYCSFVKYYYAAAKLSKNCIVYNVQVHFNDIFIWNCIEYEWSLKSLKFKLNKHLWTSFFCYEKKLPFLMMMLMISTQLIFFCCHCFLTYSDTMLSILTISFLYSQQFCNDITFDCSAQSIAHYA